MNTGTNNIRKATAKAKDVATIRQSPVWLHITTTRTFYIDYIPEWWSEADLKARREAGEIIDPE